MFKLVTNCLWNNLVDDGHLGLCDAMPDAYPLLPGDCPCEEFTLRDQSISRDQQAASIHNKERNDG